MRAVVYCWTATLTPQFLIRNKSQLIYQRFSDSEVKSLNIMVATEKGVVTLTGSASNQEKIEKAVKITSNIHSVKSVKNQLVVHQ